MFLLTIADSGERKSTCDGFFIQAIRDYQAEQQVIAKPLLDEHHALTPKVMTLSDDATAGWVAFYDKIECEQLSASRTSVSLTR